MLTLRGLGAVLGDLAALGFDARWGVLGASALGAPHRRERIWIAAYADPDFVRAPWTFQTQRRAADLHKKWRSKKETISLSYPNGAIYKIGDINRDTCTITLKA
jgi:DNA (cytosine-5)-methyltransferase 1